MTRGLAALACALLLVGSEAHAAAAHWVGSWGASPAPPQEPREGLDPRRASPSFEDQTIVQTVRLSAGGRRLRVRFSNEYGRAPLAIGAASVSLAGGPARALTFAGRPDAVVPPGAPLLSDPVDLAAPALASLKVALYVKGKAPVCTCHFAGLDNAAVSPAGDYTARPFEAAATGYRAYRAFVSGVEVEAPAVQRVIVTLGDSITDGTASTVGANRRWPDRLAERAGGRTAVVNAGIAGNRVLSEGVTVIFGQSALTRFDRDVLSVPGATHLVILEGVNDLGVGGANPPSAAALIAGYRQMIERARAHGLKVIGGTILPYEGAAYFNPAGEAVRQEINAWIRTGGAFDGVIDFDAATRDPAKPTRMRADLQSGDWLHPNDAGYRAMGDAVDLKLFR
jgi:lysophospholipase L1-like esterase